MTLRQGWIGTRLLDWTAGLNAWEPATRRGEVAVESLRWGKAAKAKGGVREGKDRFVLLCGCKGAKFNYYQGTCRETRSVEESP